MALVLVADDNREFAELLRALLEDAGHTVITAYSGLAAIAVVEQHPIDCAVLDVLIPQISGDATAGTRIFSATLSKWTAPEPEAIQTAPISPPNSACDELDGSPTSQVTRFHRIAPISPPNTTAGVTLASSTIPLEIVFATSVDRNAPTRFSTPEIATATFGFSAPVAIEVAMAFAVSWKPLVKSNASAVTMTTRTRNEMSTARPSPREVAEG